MQTLFFRRGQLYICLLFLLAACARPTPSPTVTPTANPTDTPTPSPSPTNTPSPTALPTSTPAPTIADAAELLPRAEAFLADGDYDSALQIYELVQENYAGTEVSERARLYTAQTYLSMGQMISVTQVLSPALSPLSPAILQQAQFLQAEAFRESGRYILALPLYQAYIQGGTNLEDVIAERMAWCYQALGLHGQAAEAFTNAAVSYRSLSAQVWLLEEAAGEFRALGNTEQALARYENILAVSRNPWYRATILYQMGETLLEAGRTEEARARWQEILDTYPEENAASWAVDSLLAAGVELSPYTVAQAYRAAGRAWDALPWLEEAAAQDLGPARELGFALAWARSAVGDLEGALSELDGLHQSDPADPQPLLEQGRLLGEAGSISQALETYGQVQTQYAGTSEAGEALWRSAGLLEGQNHLQEAVSSYQGLLESYPDHERAPEARFRAGLLRYQQGRFSDAASLWAQGGEQDFPRSTLWQGLALAQAGQVEEARAAWGAAASGEGYYADRARELLSTKAGFGQFHGLPVAEGEDQERIQAEHWLSEFWGQPVTTTLPLEVQQNVHFLQGQELLSLGRPDQAGQSFSLLIEDFRYDGPSLYALALYLRQIGLHGHAILCADHIDSLLPDEESEATPFILRLRYPTAYGHLVAAEAQANNIDPLLLFAMIRRESYFDRYASSWADAHGLTQVIPSTGEWIAGQLGFHPFRVEDLYRPIVSIRFGAWYLGDQLRTFEGQSLPALSAYNGGPGNALRWAGHVAPAPDLDLFVEAVDFTETRGYIKGIYTDYWVYRQLYAGE